ncbi:MAG: acetylornithine/succinylornithine family transaminase [Phycisphaeraceae bacterium]|nr:acetylornithine/succinylornithine family transaminase [Phycisphaeraceae bacterium]
MTINYGRYPIAMVKGEGSYLWDAEGKRYLDLFCGFGAGLLGHCHPALVDAVTKQARTLWHSGNLTHTLPQTQAAQAIWSSGFHGRSFFCHSGADANEAAFKLARLYGRKNPGKQGKRYKIISAQQSFHGRTFGTMVATAQKKVSEGYEPLMPGYTCVPYDDLKAVEAAVDEVTVAVIVEPIQGEGGVRVPSDGFLPGLRKLCDDRDLLLICDEVWTGGGRTGKWFAHQHWNIVPDMMTLAKGVGGGLPVGVMCAHERVAGLFDHRRHGTVAHATTLGGNCLSMAAAAAVFRTIEAQGLLDHANKIGNHAMTRLRAAMKRSGGRIAAVRGKGLFIGVELNPQAKGATFKNAGEIVDRCRQRGVLVNATQNVVIRLAPSLAIGQEEMDEGLSVLEQVILG